MPAQRSSKPKTKRAYATRLGGRFLLLNMVRMRYRRPSAPSRPYTVHELEGTKLLALLLRDQRHDMEVPDFLSKATKLLTQEEKALLREEFYNYCNMTAPELVRWSKDKRLADGCGPVLQIRNRTIDRLKDIFTIKTSAKKDGKNWNTRLYATAQECVFVFYNLYHPRRVDYINWALLRGFGLKWEQPTRYTARQALPLRVRVAAQLALRRRQFTGKPKRPK